MTLLRDYQRRTIDQLYDWFASGKKGHPCIEMPTGAGKSHIVAELCKEAIQTWPDTRVLMLTHVKELIEQNAEKMLEHWPDAPLGIYSAGIGRRDAGQPITFAGIQSVRNKAEIIGHVDLVIIDECHLVSHKDEGGYRKLINKLLGINPALRVIGLTATPYRLGHGYITDAPALFSEILSPVSIEELIYKKFLAPLRSKNTAYKLSVEGVHKVGGEYVEAELQAAINTDKNNRSVIEEVLGRASDRKSWLFFCTGVKHAETIAEMLNDNNISAACILGETPKAKREEIISKFKRGEIRALTNANVLTTGYDYPDLDLIVMLRPTLSTGLYVQMAGRGMRIKSHAEDCIVLDFAGVVATHGPITAVEPKKAKQKTGEIPYKTCPQCQEMNHLAAKVCTACGYEFPPPQPPKPKLHNDDIMGLDKLEMVVTDWQWSKHVSYTSGKEMLTVRYYGELADRPVMEYLTVAHSGYSGDKARRLLLTIAQKAGVDASGFGDTTLEAAAEELNKCRHPSVITYKQEGKFYRVFNRVWHDPNMTNNAN